ncbi:MAG: ATP-grasp domain-containing protein [Bifidobacteriaceae bacterium]|nr:ATP-grasp domain-containing protein [Bifidobacteriaceae bacterium]
MFARVLIANRGEIAVRVARACKDAGLRSIAVYGSEDRDALHVQLADEAFSLGDGPVGDTYLNIDRLLDIAHRAGADAVHPGYGFGSESAEFARRVQDAGLTWIGPPPAAIAALGDKVQARAIAKAVGATLLPGTDRPIDTADAVRDFAGQHGFPLMVKAAHGGGGRGLRVVRAPEQIDEAFASAAREAKASFGRAECFIERYIDAPRHIETQCLADAHGTVAVLSTRDCSIQRRHQKLIEEAPAPFLPPHIAAELARVSRAVLREVGYVGAATVEFLVWTDDVESPTTLGTPTTHAAFLEVNARLQVEHPVTEEICGIDLVREQFRIAAGEALGYEDPPTFGHAIECRINAEDPAAGFAPSPGPLNRLRLPGGPGVRLDFGFVQGDRVSASFDSMLGKIVVRGRDRTQAIERMARALAELEVGGVATSTGVLSDIIVHPAFAADAASKFAVHTRFVETELDPPLAATTPPTLADASEEVQPTGRVVVEVGGKRFEVVLPAGLIRAATPTSIRRPPRPPRRQAPAGAAGPANPDGSVVAPMQGVIVQVPVSEGEMVQAGQTLVVLEAMKMEQPLAAPKAGTVRGLTARPGEKVAAGTVLLHLDA